MMAGGDASDESKLLFFGVWALAFGVTALLMKDILKKEKKGILIELGTG